MKEAEKLLLDKENFISIIDELTNKVSVFYEEMKSLWKTFLHIVGTY